MFSRKLTILMLAVVCFAVVFALGNVKLQSWRQSRQISREIAWIQEAVQQLQKSPAPAPELIQSATTGRWEIASSVGSYLIFSNGWASCRTHSWHRNDGLDDIAVLKMPDGGFYLSRYHFEFGIEAETLVRRPNVPDVTHATYVVEMAQPDGSHSKPADAKDFLDNGGRWQGWYLFS